MNLKKCPYCGCGTYYTKHTVSGNSNFKVNFDGSEAENGDMHDGLSYKLKSKYAFCYGCNKELFKVE